VVFSQGGREGNVFQDDVPVRQVDSLLGEIGVGYWFDQKVLRSRLGRMPKKHKITLRSDQRKKLLGSVKE
jgi:hypothetical protein